MACAVRGSRPRLSALVSRTSPQLGDDWGDGEMGLTMGLRSSWALGVWRCWS